MTRSSEADFDDLSWHDDTIYGLALRSAEPEIDDWTSDLILDIDHIVEWVRSGDDMLFRVAPATLSFHGVTDLALRIEWPATGFQASYPPPSIDRIRRRRVADQKVHLDRPYWAWSIGLSSPDGGEIRFGAVGFTQTLRREPILCEQQQLPYSQRAQSS